MEELPQLHPEHGQGATEAFRPGFLRKLARFAVGIVNGDSNYFKSLDKKRAGTCDELARRGQTASTQDMAGSPRPHIVR